MFIFLCLWAQAFALDALESLLSINLNNWGKKFRFEKGIITGMNSVHSSSRGDRKWRFYYTIPFGFACRGQRFYNGGGADYPMNFKCPTNHAISAIESRYDWRTNDRSWRFWCCELKGRTYDEVRLTGDLNSYGGPMDFKCSSSEVLVGLKSRHNNQYEDRIWQARCATLVTPGQVSVIGEHTLTEYLNYWDGLLVHRKIGYVITGLASVHSNWYQDRRFKIYYARLNIPCRSEPISEWINQYDRVADFKCPANSALNFIKSVHNNWYEDRRFMFGCCDLSNGGEYTIETYLTEYVNKNDRKMDKTCPNNEVLVGLYSKHNNWYNDRRYKFYCGSVMKA